jgi:hypothetical protein
MMKKFLIIFFLFAAFISAQDSSITVVNKNYYKFTSTGTVDTFDIKFQGLYKNGENLITVYAKSTGVDTLNIFTRSTDDSLWVRVGVRSLFGDSVTTSIISNTMAKEYILLDPEPKEIRVVNTSDDGSTSAILISGKRGR